MIYTTGFWVLITILPTMSLFAYHKYSWTTIIVQIISLPILVFVSASFSKQNTLKEWVSIVFFSGVRKIARHMTLLSNKNRKDENDVSWWEPAFEYWFGFSIKYFMPTALIYCMMNTLRSDFQDRYGGYPIGTNFIGWSVVIFGFLIVFVPIFLCTKEEPFAYDVDKPFDLMAKEDIEEKNLEKIKNNEKKESKDEEDPVVSEDQPNKDGKESETDKTSKNKEEPDAQEA